MKHISLYVMTGAMLVLSAGCTIHMGIKAMTDESMKLSEYGLLSEAAQKKESQYPQLSSAPMEELESLCILYSKLKITTNSFTVLIRWSSKLIREIENIASFI